jgi:hypothetical protein
LVIQRRAEPQLEISLACDQFERNEVARIEFKAKRSDRINLIRRVGTAYDAVDRSTR